MVETKGRLRRGLSRWVSGGDSEAEELQKDVAAAGCCPITDARDRDRSERLRESVHSRYNTDAIVPLYEAFYREVLKAPRKITPGVI